jgi:hypothetical protein
MRSSHVASRARMLWRGTAAVLGVQSVGSDKRLGPAGAEKKGSEDVLPSWRSLRSLAVQETAHGLPRGSLASNGETSR